MNRRRWLGGVAATGATGMAMANMESVSGQPAGNRPSRIRHSVVYWCFNTAGDRWDLERTCRNARDLGCTSVEIVPPDQWNVLRNHGLICAMAPNGMPTTPFMRGVNNPRYHEEVIDRTKKTIDACADARFPNVIAFIGYKWRDAGDPTSGEIPRDEAENNSVTALRELARHAERRGVTVCVEHLNTRDTSHPMKGHPGYQGDDLDWVASIIRRVRSPRIKLLFDIYHVQVMHGDVIRRIEQNRDVIGHIHTAGNPGRGELDDRQEINYPAVMRKLLDIRYDGYVGHEFIPTRDALAGLRQAVQTCSVG